MVTDVSVGEGVEITGDKVTGCVCVYVKWW